MRLNKEIYYLNIAEEVAKRSTCLRRKYGAIIVKNDEIIATGYNGAPRGRKNCNVLGFCLRDKMRIPHGERYELCRSVHAEQNCIISASRRDMIGSTMYLSGFECDVPGDEEMKCENAELYVNRVHNLDSCNMCKRFIINSGIERVIMMDASMKCGYREVHVNEWVENENNI